MTTAARPARTTAAAPDAVAPPPMPWPMPWPQDIKDSESELTSSKRGLQTDRAQVGATRPPLPALGRARRHLTLGRPAAQCRPWRCTSSGISTTGRRWGGAAVDSSGGAAVDSSGGAAVDNSGGAAVDSSGGAAVDSSGGAAVDNSGGAAVDSSGGAAVDSSGGAAVDSSGFDDETSWFRVRHAQ
jgi:hypothetical protein